MCVNCEGQIHKMVFTNHNFSREKRTEAGWGDRLISSAYHPDALPDNRTGCPQQVSPAHQRCRRCLVAGGTEDPNTKRFCCDLLCLLEKGWPFRPKCALRRLVLSSLCHQFMLHYL